MFFAKIICFARVFLCKGRKAPLATPVELHNCLSIKVIRQPICRHEQLSLSETLSGSRLFEHVVRVKAAKVEFSENVSAKGVTVLDLLQPIENIKKIIFL